MRLGEKKKEKSKESVASTGIVISSPNAHLSLIRILGLYVKSINVNFQMATNNSDIEHQKITPVKTVEIFIESRSSFSLFRKIFIPLHTFKPCNNVPHSHTGPLRHAQCSPGTRRSHQTVNNIGCNHDNGLKYTT